MLPKNFVAMTLECRSIKILTFIKCKWLYLAALDPCHFGKRSPYSVTFRICNKNRLPKIQMEIFSPPQMSKGLTLIYSFIYGTFC